MTKQPQEKPPQPPAPQELSDKELEQASGGTLASNVIKKADATEASIIRNIGG